ncbi:single-stranded dna-binding protein [Ligilactobacillus hayakitensis DSM 18933 = JCM 14209]|uniref:Single-stranded DNA-binding protein n=1 Tax=Ligilactobacillus hayakitensis DSM 18933 = JCM 14209 TaxID=1423755 RepID=A0A0R1WPH3_9LACO|nr:single-stranded DNA-binding protein [Ligilactobacillus hayakitensis]KRM19537.1 single-stranded dna-binding protein [Ligilactobacillus hayakitensis DSM 18933 = JCM 14209]
MINRTVLVGRLTRDPELRYTQSGAAVVSFTVAVNRQFTNQQGEREADFINCVMWRKPAENFANFTHKGSMVGIDGRLQTRSYENQQGQRVYVTEVVADNFSLLESRAESDRYREQHGQGNIAPSGQSSFDSNPFGSSSQAGFNNGNAFGGDTQSTPANNQADATVDPFSNNGGADIDISDDDLPF